MRFIIHLLILAGLIPGFLRAEEGFPFRSPLAREGFMKALAAKDTHYSEKERMIARPFSSPGYHTTLKGGTVHPTRDSLEYAVALLDSGDADRARRAFDIIDRVIGLQDQNPEHRTYGIWPWFMDEPLEQMAPPDWNWADFCGALLLQTILDHRDRLPEALRKKITDSITHACRAIIKRNVGSGYTNIAIMGGYVTLVAGEQLNNPEFRDYGKQRIQRFYDYTMEKGSFSEYNSPTYTMVAIKEISRLAHYVQNAESREVARKLEHFAWKHAARHFHAPTAQWAGPHSRAYSTLLRDSDYRQLQQALGDAVQWMDEAEAYESISQHHYFIRCPDDLRHYYQKLEKPRMENETFMINREEDHDLIGATWLTPELALGSINFGDLWNQRRPLVAYWPHNGVPMALRLQCLHDGYDYSSASFFSVQDQGDLLGAVVFATDRGDTHISLDRIQDGRIQCKDLRLRFLIEGPSKGQPTDLLLAENGSATVNLGPAIWSLQPCVHTFGDETTFPVETETDPLGARGDWILWRRAQTETLDFTQMDRAIAVFVFSMRPHGIEATPMDRIEHTTADGLTTVTWHRGGRPSLQLTVPDKPTTTRLQSQKSAGRIGDRNAWKSIGK